MTRRIVASKSSRHRAASFVTEHNNQTRAKMLDPVLDAAQSMVIDQVAGVPNDKNIANGLIENNFGRRAGIGAAENDCKRMLGLSRLGAARCGRFACRNFAVHKTRVAFLEFGQRRIRAHRSDWMICGKNKHNYAKQTNERDQL